MLFGHIAVIDNDLQLTIYNLKNLQVLQSVAWKFILSVRVYRRADKYVYHYRK